MMFCPKCGTQIPDHSKHCAACGVAVGIAAAQPAEVAAVSAPKPKRTAIILAVAGAAVVVAAAIIIAVVMALGNGSETNGSKQESNLPPSNTEPSGVVEDQQESVKDTGAEEEIETPEPDPAPVVLGPTLPDPAAFFGGATPREDEPADTSGWHLYYRTRIDEGWTASHEYVNLLCEKYGFVQSDYLTNTTLYLQSDLYFLDYTKQAIEPARDRYYGDGYVDFESDVFVWIQKNGRDEYTGVSIYFSSDLQVRDLGDRASTVPNDALGGSQSGSSGPHYETPDFAKLPCLTCDGEKDCQKCNGYGTIKRYNGNGETIDSLCPTCHGGRKCTACNGTGTR